MNPTDSMTVKRIANFAPNVGANATKLESDYYNNASPVTFPKPPLLTRFSVNPGCPHFYIFAGVSVDHTTPTAIAFLSVFTFLNAGSPQNIAKLYWGDADILGTALTGQAAPIIVPYIGSPTFSLSSGFTDGGCVLLNPTFSNSGIATRWSAVADSIEIRTSQVGVATVDTPITLVHGFMQQPWSA